MSEREEQYGAEVRHPQDWTRYVVTITAAAWSLFQIGIAIPPPRAMAWWGTLDSTIVRCVHLSFAMALAFLCSPLLRRARPQLAWLSAHDRVPVVDLALAAVGAFCASYYAFCYDAINARQGALTNVDLAVGAVVVLLLLEACRRVIGPALTVVAGIFITYAFFGHHAPSVLAFKGVSLGRFVDQMTASTQGIYGIPLDVSAKIVFLFVLFGAMLEKAGGGRFFTSLAMSVLGGFRGGPAKAAVVSSGLTGMVSGSSIANIVTTGTFTIPLMKKAGYPAKKAAAIEVAASTDGQLAPPIMGAAAFLIAEYVNVDYRAVVKAAAIPAFASYATLLYITHLEACKLGLRRIPKEELPSFKETLLGGWHFLIPLSVLIYQLLVQQRSAELAALCAVVVMGAMMLIVPVLKALRAGTAVKTALVEALRVLNDSLVSGARNMVSVGLATAAAGIIVGVVAFGPGDMISQLVEELSRGNIYAMLLITAVTSLIIGMGLPTTATYIVMASLIVPALVDVGAAQNLVIPVMAAHLFCFYFGILADDTPPVGLAAYAAAAIAKAPPIATGLQAFMYDIRTAILPFMFILNPDLILHGINEWHIGLLIFAMACVGNGAFAAATQGWFARANRWFDIPILLVVTMLSLRPDFCAGLLRIPHESRYWCYVFGLVIFSALYVLQLRRKQTCPSGKGTSRV